MIEILMDQIRVRDRQIEQLQRGIDLLQERIREMTNENKDYENWPLVPVDPKAIPEGYEVVRVGWPKEGETSCTLNCKPHTWKLLQQPSGCVPILIIRPIPKPIRLPLTIVPHGWWVAKETNGDVWCYEHQPQVNSVSWENEISEAYSLPPWIAAQLPDEWHELPWDKSVMQQTEGGER